MRLLPYEQPDFHFSLVGDHTINFAVHQYVRHIFGQGTRPLALTTRFSPLTSLLKEYLEALENFYTDDYLDSVVSPQRALNMSKELLQILQLGVLKLT